MRGGTGNQIYSLIQALILAHRASLTLSIPFVPARAIPFHSTLAPTRFGYPGEHLWDIRHMSRIAPVVSHSHPYVRRCRAIHLYYSVHRSATTVHPLTASTLPSYTNDQLCAALAPNNQSLALHLTTAQCAAPLLNTTTFRSRVLPLSNSVDNSFIHELAAIRNRLSYPASSVPPSDPVCVFVEGSSSNFANLTAIDYLYSYMHHLQPSHHIRHTVDQLVSHHEIDLSYLAVMHLRYDENECFPKSHPRFQGRLCLRVKLPTRRNDTIYWAPLEQVVKSVRASLHYHRARAVYLAASPYAPASVVSDLIHAFQASGVKVVPRVGTRLGHDLQNFIERELAIRALLFIGDFGSSWSATVHYKRRTLGRSTVWCAALCNITDPAYTLTGRLHPPSWFETNFVELAPLLVNSN